MTTLAELKMGHVSMGGKQQVVFYHPLSRWYESAAEGGFLLVAVVMNGQVRDKHNAVGSGDSGDCE